MQQQCKMAPPTNPRHVAVIGAGFAGLAAARTLLSAQPTLRVVLLEAESQIGGRARRGVLGAGPVELGATWFHGTEGNPVYEYAMSLVAAAGGQGGSGGGGGSSGGAGADAAAQQQEKPKDYTANANGSDPRWELQLVAPGEPTPLEGRHHQAMLAAFEQYSLAVEDMAEDAEAAVAAALASSSSSSSGQPGSQPEHAAGQSPAAAAAATGVSLGQVLRARFDGIMAAAETASSSSSSTENAPPPPPQQQQQGCGSSSADVSAWLASDASGQLKQAFAEGWGCRERLQRAYDGFHSSDLAGIAHVTEYQDLEGPNIPVPGGYQSVAEALAAEAQSLGLQLHLNCPVDRISWARPDGKVALLLRPTPAALSAFADGTSSSSSGGIEVVFDACVVTCSLGVLKTAAHQLFDPALPAGKAEAVQKLHIGQVEKLFVEWPPAPAAEAAPGHHQQQQQENGMQGCTEAGPAPATATKQQQQQAGSEGAAPPRLQASAVVGPRKPKPQQLHDMAPPAQAAAAAAANAAGAAPDGAVGAAAAAPAAGAPGSSDAAAASTAGSSSDEPYTTYCLMWPTKQAAWGQDWLQQQQQQQQQSLGMDIPAHDPVYVQPSGSSTAAGSSLAAAAPQDSLQQQQQQQQDLPELPEWLYGLHSWRYGDGPEWIKPAGPAANSSSGGGAGGGAGAGSDQQQQQQGGLQPASRSAVIWVTGRAAQQMGRLSDQQVLRDLELLLQAYPAIPRPDVDSGMQPDGSSSSNSEKRGGGVCLQQCKLVRSSWTSSPYFRGSYSYPGAQADGSTADALAAPLTAADAVGGGGAVGDAADQHSDNAAAGAAAAAGGGGSDRVLVCFAGEATSRVHMGTVHGAFNSGVREVHRLLHSWGMVQPGAAAAGGAVGADAQAPAAEYHAAFWL